MEQFMAALQVANMVASPSPGMIESIETTIRVAGVRLKNPVLSYAPDSEWVAFELETFKRKKEDDKADTDMLDKKIRVGPALV